MKIACATTLLALFAPGAWGLKKINKKTLDAIQKVNLKQVPQLRKLADEQEAEAEDEYEFLQNYEQVYVTCDAEAEMYNEKGELEYGAVVYRLCPSGAACGKNGMACKSGYGEYVVSLQSYMEAFLEQFQNQQAAEDGQEQEFDFAELGECRQYDIQQVEQEDGGEEAEQAEYFVGPICDKGDIRIAFFKGDGENDEAAQCIPANESNDFATLTGLTLPWSSSILEDTKCMPYYCSGVDDNGDVVYNEFCTQLFEQATSKCETNMAFYSANGIDETGCEVVEQMMAKTSSSKGGAGGLVVFALLVVCVVGFGAWYFVNQKKKSAVNSEGLMM